MKQTLMSLTVAGALFAAGVVLATDTPGTSMLADAPTTQPAAVDLGNTICPVSGEKVGDSKLTVTYDGKIYHFCCDDCPKKFNQDPATYAKAVAADPAKYGVSSK